MRDEGQEERYLLGMCSKKKKERKGKIGQGGYE